MAAHRVKSAIKSILTCTCSGFLKRHTGLATCLTYHTIVPEKKNEKDFNPNLPLMVYVEHFEEQISYLSRNFRCLDLKTAVTQLQEGRLEPGSVMVTFDDGYRDNLEVALPVLEKYEVPATIFVTTGFVDGTIDLWWHELACLLNGITYLEYGQNGDRVQRSLRTPAEKMAAFNEMNSKLMGLSPEGQRQLLLSVRQAHPGSVSCRSEMLDWESVLKLDRHPLITIGSHSQLHLVLSTLSDEALGNELNQSRKTLETKLGHAVDFFCYPFGSRRQAGLREYEAARAAGFLAAFTTCCGHIQPEHRNHLTSLPRIDIGYRDKLVDFRWKLSGLESFRHNRGRRLALY